MKTLLRSILLITGVALLASCSVTGPEESSWKDVSAFSWPTALGASMKYVEENSISGEIIKTREVTVELPANDKDKAFYNGELMFMLGDPSEPFSSLVRFLPLEDTLVVKAERFGGEFALVAPIEKNHTWVSGYIGEEPAWQATIMERFAYRKIEGTVYNNVVVVKYRRIDGIREHEEWIRFYAEGIGPVLTIRNVYPSSSFSEETIPQQQERIVLVERSTVN